MSRTLSSVTIVATRQRSRGSVTKTFSRNAKSQVEALTQFTFQLNRAVTLQEKHVNKKKTERSFLVVFIWTWRSGNVG